MKKYLLFATALAALASCTSDDFTGDKTLGEANGQAPISFGFDVLSVTRSEGATAATALNNQFIVYAEKSESSGSAPTEGNLVFQNYQVNYVDNTAYTTTSNTKNWEYVGVAHSSEYQSHITTSTTDVQTIKYWDYGASNYVFTAVSALPADITAGRVSITKNTSGTTVYDKGYTITLAKTAGSGSDPNVYPDFSKIYFSDRDPISSGSGTDREGVNAYGGVVKLTFRNMLSQVRAGVYETIPGYDVTEIHFFVTSDAEAKVGTTSAFGAIAPNTTVNDFEGSLNVTYYNSGEVENQPKVEINSGSTAAKTDLILGTNLSTLSTSNVLGQTSTVPTWDTEDGTYTKMFPQINNNENLKLKVNYKLYNSVTKEVINVTGATAEVPSKYLQWKPNFKYTYLFKISDNSNGHTGPSSSPAGLYPITFDAIVIEAENGQAEYITTVSEPSITTFGTKTVSGKTTYVTGGSDYAAGTDVYAVVEDGSSLATLSADNMQLYTVTTTDATNFPITAASVAEALIEGPRLTKAEADNAKIVPTASSFTEYSKTVPAEDGTTKTLDTSNNKAAKFTTVNSGSTAVYYAIVYEKTAATYTYDAGKNDYTAETFAAAGTLYERSGSEGSYTYTEAEAFTSGTTYYKATAVANKGVYAIKIVTCPVTP